MNRASHTGGCWFIFLTFCMQRRRVLYNHNVTRQKTRSGLWENEPPSCSPPLWWVHCFAAWWLLLFCWALEVNAASTLIYNIYLVLMSFCHAVFWLKAETEEMKWHLSRKTSIIYFWKSFFFLTRFSSCSCCVMTRLYLTCFHTHYSYNQETHFKRRSLPACLWHHKEKPILVAYSA